MVANEKGEEKMSNKILLKLVLPKGHLEGGSLDVFEKAGLKVKIEPRKHLARVDGGIFSEVLFTRSKQVPVLLERQEKGYDLGICGQDIIVESGVCVEEIMKLDFNYATTGSVRIVLFCSADDPIQSASEVPNGTEIYTEYPNLTKKFFDNLGIKIKTVYSEGSTEADVPAGYRFGVCVTETGKSIVANGLKIIAEIFESSTVLVASKEAMLNPEKRAQIYIVQKLLASVLDAKESVLVMFNVESNKKDEVLRLIPSLKEPTIAPLFGNSSFAVTSVIAKKEVNSIMIKALQSGATDWVELSITRLVRQW